METQIEKNFNSQKLFSKNNILLIFFVVYLILRFGFTTYVDSFGIYASYFLELFFCVFAVLINLKSIKTEFGKWRFSIFKYAFAALIVGAITLVAGTKFHISIPFDFSQNETLLFLLIIGPILEEFLFRNFAWSSLNRFNSNSTWIITSLLFSYSHLHSIWFVPNEFYPFVIYQSIYTLPLGLTCGYMIKKYRSLCGAILVHTLFNLGFYLACFI